jgi:probable HAF family extracellular repeat protein
MAHGINVYGEVVGKAQKPSKGWYPFLWKPAGAMVGLDTLGGCHVESQTVTYCGVAEAINASGDIVGTSGDASGHLRAVLWRNGKVFDLNGRFSPQSDWLRLEWAMDINVGGHIAGFGYRSVGGGWQRSPFLLVPK